MSKLRILIIEDNPADDKLIRYELSRVFDFEAVTVDTEHDVSEKLDSYHPGLILSDYSLPGFSGLRALEIRNEKAPLTPFIIVTGSVNEEVAVNCIKSGASDYVTKEHLMRLNIAIKNVLEQQKIIVAKEEAERNLHKSLERFRKFVENDISGDYIETEDKVFYCNKKILEIFEFDNLEQFNTYGNINLYEDPNDRKQFIRKLKEEGKIEDFEVRMHTRTGRKITLLENAYAEFDKNGRLFEIQGYLIDITQRIVAEEKLKHSENLFRTMAENTSAGVVIYDKNKFLYSNQAVTKMIGYSEEEMKAMHFWDVVHPLDRPLVKERGKKRLSKAKVPKSYQFRLLSKSGKTVWIDFTASFFNFEGKHTALGTVRDITKEKQAYDEVRIFSFVVSQSPLSVVITDIDANIEYVNDTFTKVTGYSFQEVIGQNPRILQSGKTSKHVYAELWETLTKGQTWRGEFVNKRKNGETHFEYAVITPIKNEEGKVTRYIGMKEDITQRKTMEYELKSAKVKAEEGNRLKSAFLANISHELRTPLNGILGFSELIQELNDVESIREMSSYINESGQRLLRTLDMIIAISRLDSGTYEIKKEEVDVIAEFRNIYREKLPLAQKKNLKITFDTPFEHFDLLGDRTIISSAFKEIVDNAIKFTNKGEVNLMVDKMTENNKEYIYFEVKDTGIGISKENRKTIFEDFRQESAGYGRKYEGNGLGLSLAKKYIELIGGFLKLESVEGKGSTFTIYISVK